MLRSRRSPPGHVRVKIAWHGRSRKRLAKPLHGVCRPLREKAKRLSARVTKIRPGKQSIGAVPGASSEAAMVQMAMEDGSRRPLRNASPDCTLDMRTRFKTGGVT
jgi:hypothetical protein